MRLAAAAVAAALLVTSCSAEHGPPADRRVRQEVLTDVEAAEGTKAFGDPAALAFAANGDLWVGNYESSTLARYPADAIKAWGTPDAATVIEGGAIKGPNAMVFDAHGYLWVAMYDGDRVAGFTPADLVAGRPPSLVLPDPGGVLRKPAGVALDADGNLWVANAGVGHLVRYPRRGGLEAGTARPDVVLDVVDAGCQGVGVRDGLLWLGCPDVDTAYAYALPAKSGRPAVRTTYEWQGRCGPVQFAPAPDGTFAVACYHTGSVTPFEGGAGPSAPGAPFVRGRQAQVLTHVHGIAYDAEGALWAGTNLNVIVRYALDATSGLPAVVLRPKAAPLPSISSAELSAG
ncbi:MAG TPA: hypothetical protein VF519_12760 [Mycobacteriales bacterium]|jgi:hypothetical protein